MSYKGDPLPPIYRDTGCSWHPQCLTCPFVECRYDRHVLGGPTPDHGTVVMYKSRGCRCDACRTANAEYVREYRRRRIQVAG